jgi:hypothetical protein
MITFIMMKLVREHIIFEKFTEDSDPIKDMGIGIMYQIEKWIKEIQPGSNYTKDDFLWLSVRSRKIEFIKFLLDAGFDVHKRDDEAIKSACEVGDTEIVKLLIDAGANVNADDNAPLRRACRNEENEMIKYLLNTGKFKIEDILDLKEMYERSHPNSAHILNDYILKQKRIKESLNEKFTEDSDPVHDMGIGIKPLIEKWLKKYGIKHYEINSNFSIDVPHNNVDLEGRHLKNLPSYIQFNYIKGYFTVINNQLTSLRGCPKEVNGFFSCENNKLKSLEYAPKKISGTFNCSYNLISKIDELPDGIKIRVEVNNNAVRFTKKQITKLLNNTDTGDSIKTIVIRL